MDRQWRHRVFYLLPFYFCLDLAWDGEEGKREK